MRLLCLLVLETSHVQMLDVALSLLKKLLWMTYWPVTQCFKLVISVAPNFKIYLERMGIHEETDSLLKRCFTQGRIPLRWHQGALAMVGYTAGSWQPISNLGCLC